MHLDIQTHFSNHPLSTQSKGTRAPHLMPCTPPGMDNTSVFSLTSSPFPITRKHSFSHTAILPSQPHVHGGQTDSRHFAPPHHKPAQSNYQALLQLGTHCCLIYSSRAARAAGGWSWGQGMHGEKPMPYDSRGNANTWGLVLPAPPACTH